MTATDLLAGRTALVTGGTLGIGFGIATQLKEHGAQVAVTGLTEQECAQAREAGFSTHVLDVRDREACTQVVADVVAEFGGLDVLASNAGVYPQSSIEQMTDEHIDLIFDINVKGTIHAVQAAMPELIKLDQLRHGGLDGVDGALDVDVEDEVNVLVGHLLDGGLRVDAGVGGEHVQPAELRDDVGDDLRARLAVADVQDVGGEPGLSGLGALLFGESGDGDLRPVLLQLRGDAESDAERASGDEGGASGEQVSGGHGRVLREVGKGGRAQVLRSLSRLPRAVRLRTEDAAPPAKTHTHLIARRARSRCSQRTSAVRSCSIAPPG